MARQERTKDQDKDAKKQQSQAAQANRPENEAKLPAEQGAGERTHDRPMFLPRVDIYETETGLVVAADLPGVKPDGLEVTLEKRVLSIYGLSRRTHGDETRSRVKNRSDPANGRP